MSSIPPNIVHIPTILNLNPPQNILHLLNSLLEFLIPKPSNRRKISNSMLSPLITTQKEGIRMRMFLSFPLQCCQLGLGG
jgi:hypothetical protein